MKKSVLVIFGSMSSEHEISCISASSILENIDESKYEVSKLGIDKKGTWYLYTGDNKNIKNNYWIQDEKNKKEIIDIFSELKKYDVVFPVLHGKYGEDGSIQGVLDFANVKYVGCDILGSSIAIDKILSKELAKKEGINIVPYVEVIKGYNKNLVLNRIKESLEYPVIVKPNKEGSSYGVTKVDSESDLFDAIDFALKYDSKILVEKYISNRKEVECAVIQKCDKEIYTSTPGEINSANEFYDFNAKYQNSKSTVSIPANISIEEISKIKGYSEIIFKALKLSGLARVDFFVSCNDIYFNEVNTMPGFTSISMYPMMLEYDGINMKETIDILIQNAISR